MRQSPCHCSFHRLAGSQAPSLRGRYSASSLLRACPPPHAAEPARRRVLVGGHTPPPLGLPVLRLVSYACMPSPLPRRDRWVLRPLIFPSDVSLPRISGASAPALSFSRPARRSLHVTACMFAELPTESFSRSASTHVVTSMRRSERYRLERPVAGRESHPLKTSDFARCTEIAGLAPRALSTAFLRH